MCRYLIVNSPQSPYTVVHCLHHGLTARVCTCAREHVLYSLVWDDLEDQVVQHCELLRDLQGRMVLKRLSFTLVHRLTHTSHGHMNHQNRSTRSNADSHIL